ncbi:A-kinase anchor protein 200-like [Leptopilina boulardi]|uniref:A-kinase anchor protein 200-like n=1 Tax=Leptopilina boulardi TaxID=63433 RepID=UPI0021F505FB|nr:A-kinase anchor protein 200-like [Leptopilina boulardi]
MGARQSKRSVDITTTPKKEGLPAEGSVGDAAAPGDGKLERIEEADTKPTTNGIGPHTETVEEKNQDEATEKDKEEVKSEETKAETPADAPAEAAEVTTPTEATPASQNTATSPESKETKKKDKSKKHKFSFRTFSFGKKDKTKPAREDTPKNGDVTKEEPLVEGGEEAENAAASSPIDKSEVSSPVESEAAPAKATEAKEMEKPAEEKKDEATSVEKEKPAEKVEIADKVEVSGEDATAHHTEPIATPSIIERKTSEDLPSRFPSSPPPTPIDPSPLQQAQQAAASATALAEALKLPAEAASNNQQSILLSFDEHTDTPKESIIANIPPTTIVDEIQEIVQESKKHVLESMKVQEINEAQKISDNNPTIDNQDSPSVIEIENNAKEIIETKNDEIEKIQDLVIETEEGPIPISDNDIVFEAKPAMIIPEDKKVEILLDVGEIKDEISSTTVSDQMFAAGESIKIPAIEQTELTSASEPTVIGRINEEILDEIPPPLPDSPAPALQETSKFLNFMNAEIPPLDLPEQIPESLIETEISESILNNQEPKIQDSIQPTENHETLNDLEIHDNEKNPACAQVDDISDSFDLPPVITIPQELVKCEEDSFTYPLPPDDVSSVQIPAARQESTRIPVDSILTPPQSPNNPGSVISCTITATTRTCNRELEPISDNNSMMMERLADNETQASQLSNGHVAADDHQSISEPEAPVENNVSANEVSTTESADEAPKVPPPAVPVEVTVAPALAPVITEDVASVTKAIEEIDITEKAVAAAVKEAIENSNANEIVIDSNHQSRLNE